MCHLTAFVIALCLVIMSLTVFYVKSLTGSTEFSSYSFTKYMSTCSTYYAMGLEVVKVWVISHTVYSSSHVTSNYIMHANLITVLAWSWAGPVT